MGYFSLIVVQDCFVSSDELSGPGSYKSYNRVGGKEHFFNYFQEVLLDCQLQYCMLNYESVEFFLNCGKSRLLFLSCGFFSMKVLAEKIELTRQCQPHAVWWVHMLFS